jgi:hypothetical protein
MVVGLLRPDCTHDLHGVEVEHEVGHLVGRNVEVDVHLHRRSVGRQGVVSATSL